MNLGISLGVGIPILVGVQLALIFWLQSARRKKMLAEISAEIQQSGERVVDGPGWAQKREGHISVIGSLLVTDKRILFMSGGGKKMSIPFTDIVNVRRDKSFNGSYFSGLDWVILTTRGASHEVGFVTRLRSLETALRQPATG